MSHCYLPPENPTPEEIEREIHRKQEVMDKIGPLLLLGIFAACGLTVSILSNGASGQ